jgi:hypothetical protein
MQVEKKVRGKGKNPLPLEEALRRNKESRQRYARESDHYKQYQKEYQRKYRLTIVRDRAEGFLMRKYKNQPKVLLPLLDVTIHAETIKEIREIASKHLTQDEMKQLNNK